MLILRPYETRLLMPVPVWEWRTPSLAQPKDQLGNENCTRFRLTAMLHDGFVKWRGWFESREDADAFLWAMVEGSLGIQPALWRLPTPMWNPDLGEDLSYYFATVSFLTTPTGSNQTYTSPSDWDNSNNTIETLGAGGSGAAIIGTRHGTGGGGGAWNKIANFSFATPGTTTATHQLGTGGTAVSRASGAGAGVNSGVTGGDTWFNATTLAGSSVGSKGGVGGIGGAGSQTGSAGGAGASGVGTSSNNGGRAGSLTGASGDGASGGGGAAGQDGAGGAGGDSTSTSSGVMTVGGTGDAGSGGTAGSTSGGAGGAGTNWDGTHGSGGGGGGNSGSGSRTAGAGGNYGAGGGAADGATNSTSGVGIQGIIIITYTPLVSLLYTQLERGLRGVIRGVIH